MALIDAFLDYLNEEVMYFLSKVGRVDLGGCEKISCFIHKLPLHATRHI